MFPANFGYVAARSVEDALQLMAKHGEDGKLLAGGHSLIPAMKLRLQSPQTLIDLGTVPGLRGVSIDGNSLVIGALTVHADVASSELVRKHVPALAEAAAMIGDVQVRNRGTIGGSVAHADPAADLPVVLTSLNASFVASLSADGRALVLKPLNAPALTAAQALELWSVPAQGGPRSLGLVRADQATTLLLQAGVQRSTAAFAVSIEPAGGSPTGAPTGPIVSLGRV